MYKRILVFTLAMMCLSATALWAQRGAWEGCTIESMKAKYTDQQIGGFLLHESATLVKEASQAIVKARTPDQRRLISKFLSKASRKMERISIIMGEKKLSQKDIEKFHQDMSKIREQMRRLSRYR